MPIDTADKRASAIHVRLPWRGLLPFPDAAVENQADRQQVSGLYRGILAGASAGHVIPAILEDLTTLWCLTYQPALHAAHAVGLGFDDTTLIHADLVHALGYDGEQDLNTAYAKYIDTEF